MSWTQERIDILRELWLSSYSASQIAAELGGVTRNAVIGKAHRIGLKGKGGAPTPGRNRIDGTKAPPIKRRGAFFPRPVIVKPALPLDLPDEKTPVEQRQSLMQLTHESCRFPIGDPGHPEFFFCGGQEADLAAGHPYCKRHSKRARQPR